MKKIASLFFLAACAKEPTVSQNFQDQPLEEHHHGQLVVVDSYVRNPIPSDKESIERGRRAYLTFCGACHGEKGRGDGPEAVKLNPKPSDLSNLGTARSDYQIFLQMSLGGLAMPQQRVHLSEKERWDIVNFLRTLSKGG